MNPVVSVIVPARDGERFIAETLHSVLAQDWRRLQVIVCDDGSTDGTPDLLRTFGDSIEVIRQENQGVSAARNRAAAQASGDYLAFIDQDDLWEPDRISRQIAAHRADPGAAFVYSDAWIIDSAGRVRGRRSDHLPCAGGGIFRLLLRRNFVPIETLLMPAEVFRGLGGFDGSLRFLEDWDLALRASAGGTAIYLPEPLARYRVHDANLSRQREPMLAEWGAYALRLSERFQGLDGAERRFLKKESALRFGEAAWLALRRLDFAASAAYVASAPGTPPAWLRARLLAFRMLLHALPRPLARRIGHVFEERRLLGVDEAARPPLGAPERR